MGQTQLLLVILGIILVGIAIFIGVQLFRHNAVDDVRNAVMTDLNNYAARALAYYGKPATQGGGDKSFDEAIVLFNVYTVVAPAEIEWIRQMFFIIGANIKNYRKSF